MSLRLTSLAAAVLALGVAGSASAQSAQDTLNISAQMLNDCTIQVDDPYGLELYNSSETGSLNLGNLWVSCNQGATYSVTPDNGLNFGVNATHVDKRAIVDGLGNSIPYTLHRGGDSTVWGTDADAITGTGNGTMQPHVFGFTFFDANLAPAGVYTDDVIVTATWN